MKDSSNDWCNEFDDHKGNNPQNVESFGEQMRVHFSSRSEIILVATAVEYRNWGLWHEIWYDEDDYARFFHEATRKVRFNPEVRVILVATKDDYLNWGLTNLLWYDDDDYRKFHEIRKQEIDSIRARKLMEFTDGIPSPTFKLNDPESKLYEEANSSYNNVRVESFDDTGMYPHPCIDSNNTRNSYRVFTEKSSLAYDNHAGEKEPESIRSPPVSKEDDADATVAYDECDDDDVWGMATLRSRIRK